jgi:DNA (cytosine-5)-methyltransferase 1
MPKLLDLFCGAGGAAVGYHRAGFDEIVGVDINPQPRYPFEFVQADALEYVAEHGHEFDVIHASPPCQAFSIMTKTQGRGGDHPDLISPTRTLLTSTNKPYVIENVPMAPLCNPIMLCGTMFRLQTSQGNQLRRHRLFELSFPDLLLTPVCSHNTLSSIGVHGGGQHPSRRHSLRGGRGRFGIEARREVMGIDWMTGAELNESIPPAYTEYIGKELLKMLGRVREPAR